MPEIWDILGGFKFFLGMSISGLFISYIGGRLLDWMTMNLPSFCSTIQFAGKDATQLCIDAGIGTPFDVSGNVMLAINLFYAICYGMAIIGVVGFVLSLVRRTRQDVLLDTQNPQQWND